MTKQEMQTKLCLYNGVGVEVNNSNYYFYEAFNNDFDNCFKRIYKQFKNSDSLVFFTNKWAKQLQIKEYMALYLKMVELADKAEAEMIDDPTNEEKEKAFDEAYKREFDYMMFIIKEYMNWTGIDFHTAKKHIITNQIHYSKIS